MIKRNNLFLCVSIVLMTTLNLCLSKPTTSAGTIDNNDTETNGNSQIFVNEIIHILGDNGEVNTISSKDSDYRSHYAAQMLSYMNRSVYPCEDFYEYACGNWKNVIDERQATHKRNNILDIVYKLADIVDNLLQRPHINDVAPEYAAEFELAKKFYSNCLKAELHPMRASSEYLAILKEIGGFPAVNAEWNAENFHWLNMSGHLSNYGIKNIVNEAILPEYPFPPYFKMPEFGFDIELHYETIENTSSNAYKENEKRMRDILTIYGVEENRIAGIITDTFEFLKEILKVKQQFNEDDFECSFLSNLMEESEISALKNQWRSYNEIAWMGKRWENISDELEDCCTPCLYLYDKISTICGKHKEAAANYLSLKFLYHMDSRIKDTKFQKDFCTLSLKSSMKYFFDHLYMKLYFNDELHEEVSVLIKEIRQSLRLILQEANWLDEPTRQAALLKESTIAEYIGRYENMNITKRLIEELKQLKFVNGSYEANNLNLRKFKQYMTRFNGLNFEELDNTTKPLDLVVGMQVNSFYYNLDNSIYVMAGTLLPPVYNKAWPNSLKYGTLGYLIGHEFTHGFDTVGANYDEAGQANYWWSNKSGKVFKERSKCYADHYQRYLIPEINRNINGNLTNDENIADGGGLREALMAYRRYIKNVTKELDSISALYKEEQMPGLDLSPEQLFFLGFAQLWCASYKEADYWDELTDEHTIDKYRVLGAVSNNVDFAKVYNCPVGSKMNPTSDKCEVW
ncbi:membrane metallo-endopeptidase-like 1 [Calliphora vicina]|uniref:membrane metallo-endopeptidase-like 1 n=1 Tax=Calliphora vicina TaxID=7373 RepID=UPI00325A71BD